MSETTGPARLEARVQVEAPPERVYDLVSDVTRMGEWSPECYRAEWVGGATGPAPGARFKGWNRQGLLRWQTTPTVEVAEPGREFAFVTRAGRRDATRWRYRLSPAGAGTELVESCEILHQPLPIKLYHRVTKRDAAIERGMAATLERIKQAAERAGPA